MRKLPREYSCCEAKRSTPQHISSTFGFLFQDVILGNLLKQGQRRLKVMDRSKVLLDRNVVRSAARYGLLIGVTLVVVGCVSVRVEPLTDELYPPRLSDEPVQWLETEPDFPYVELAKIVATSQSADEDHLRDKILARAKTIGADAVVLGKSNVLQFRGSGTPYESTLGPAADSFNSNVGGWWNPFYYDAWSFTQGGGDQTRWIQYLSGTAIRYSR